MGGLRKRIDCNSSAVTALHLGKWADLEIEPPIAPAWAAEIMRIDIP